MACTVREQNGLNAVVDYDNGDKYEGVWNANLCKKEGFGQWSSAWIELRLPYSRHTLTPFPCTRSGKKGDVYNGPFLDDKKDGKGTYVFADKGLYTGGKGHGFRLMHESDSHTTRLSLHHRVRSRPAPRRGQTRVGIGR